MVTRLRDDKPARHLNADEKRALRVADIKQFVREYGRRAQRGIEPNDRRCDREIEKVVRRMSPEELDRFLREDE